ncbi:DNA-directed RNA polymerase subunit omega [Campylobacter sputorum subsp. bubulus]|uniref:DNA-directed RNA polymerase subunit omega n=1 Tax=Campylobacter sputorum subsp. sputorum TaxID=32024 RepID=A0A381DHR0_9BACT|nr:DNA-directed RNA polymerase subunit omega [Campylobacter sputorum]ASM35277.1 DNA-directed RNA polymerase, omega subunit [Campylobacter sputorum aubsp. sputorum RM3237]ASM36956.1 DNA-directed RNA polymerase, omega subunit [Campylobacter sputorum bv. faecalis CCUG 20703]ASM38637.1 DNA-directed RNA polymerase, omega subunit [Campylobacter sputorum bv. paraureolyticus LMG 11764]KAB0580892.1 DNA-directed RNA polymerase subunit omega [Campylobacter sputorum subsp. sputorum]MDY6120863.1 DNA-direct
MRTEQIVSKALLNFDGDRYKLSLAVAKRAKALSMGAAPLIETDTRKMKFTDIAIMEIADGKVKIEASVEAKK